MLCLLEFVNFEVEKFCEKLMQAQGPVGNREQVSYLANPWGGPCEFWLRARPRSGSGVQRHRCWQAADQPRVT